MRATMSGATSTLPTSSRSLATTGAGVFDGAANATQDAESKPGSPCSATVGRSGSAAGRLAPALASARTLLPLICGRLAGSRSKNIWMWPPMRSFMAGPVPR